MVVLVFLATLFLCVWAVAHYAIEHYRAWGRKRQEALEACAKEGHQLERIFAMDDPRFPVDKCKRCHYQVPVRYPCPHCGKELGSGR